MNNRQIEVFSSLLLLVLVVVIAIGFVQWARIDRQIEAIHEASAQLVIGTDDSLANTVQELERTLAERLEYEFTLDTDPLDLTRVITSPRLLARMGMDEFDRHHDEMRLAATIVGRDGVATILIRYMGSNHILRVGDQLAGYTVEEIGQRSAVLTRGRERLELENTPIAEDFVEGSSTLELTAPVYDPSQTGNY